MRVGVGGDLAIGERQHVARTLGERSRRAAQSSRPRAAIGLRADRRPLSGARPAAIAACAASSYGNANKPYQRDTGASRGEGRRHSAAAQRRISSSSSGLPPRGAIQRAIGGGIGTRSNTNPLVSIDRGSLRQLARSRDPPAPNSATAAASITRAIAGHGGGCYRGMPGANLTPPSPSSTSSSPVQ